MTVWCALSRIDNIGPWFFEEYDITITVASQRYAQMINELFLAKLEEMEEMCCSNKTSLAPTLLTLVRTLP